MCYSLLWVKLDQILWRIFCSGYPSDILQWQISFYSLLKLTTVCVAARSSPSWLGVFMCGRSDCGSNMDGEKTFLCILLLRAFKQHIDSCFQYFSDKEEQRKWYNDYTRHDFDESFLHQPNVYFLPPCFSIIWCQLGNLSINIELLFRLRRAFTCIFPDSVIADARTFSSGMPVRPPWYLIPAIKLACGSVL